MEKMFEEQPEAAEAAPSEDAAGAEAAGDSGCDCGEGACEGQPGGRKWAKMFDSPEKLEDAYGHIYRAYHAKCRELQQTSEALDGVVRMFGAGGVGHAGQVAAAGGQVLPGAYATGAAQGPGFAAGGNEGMLVEAVLRAQAEAQEARALGERFIVTSLESQARDFFREHPELGSGESEFAGFAREVSALLGDVDADAMRRMPEALERAYRIVTYPDAAREARRRRLEDEEEASRFVVEGGGGGSMSVPRNQARETSFRALVQRLKREAGLE